MHECLEISDICNEVFLATQLQAAWLFGKVEVFDENIWRGFFVEDRRVPAVFGTCDSPPPPPVKIPLFSTYRQSQPATNIPKSDFHSLERLHISGVKNKRFSLTLSFFRRGMRLRPQESLKKGTFSVP